MADRETKEDEGLFDAVEIADETQVAAEVWTRYFAGENTRKTRAPLFVYLGPLAYNQQFKEL